MSVDLGLLYRGARERVCSLVNDEVADLPVAATPGWTVHDVVAHLAGIVEDGLAGNIVYCMAQDAQGAFWFGTNQGLSRWDGSTWSRYGAHEGLLDSHVYSVATAPGGDVWAGTRKGVVRLAAG